MYSKTVISHKTDILQVLHNCRKKNSHQEKKQQYFSFPCEIQLSIYYIYIIIVIISKLTFLYIQNWTIENLLPYSSNILQQKKDCETTFFHCFWCVA